MNLKDAGPPYCSQCGKPLGKNFRRFCKYCGAKQTEKENIIKPVVHPMQPKLHVQPIAPIKPVQPGSPIKPITPIKPIKPVHQVQPESPVKQITPIKPIKPVHQVQPGSPVKPITPIKPIKPVHPVQPGSPIKPITPIQEGVFASVRGRIIDEYRKNLVPVLIKVIAYTKKNSKLIRDGTGFHNLDSRKQDNVEIFLPTIPEKVMSNRSGRFKFTIKNNILEILNQFKLKNNAENIFIYIAGFRSERDPDTKKSYDITDSRNLIFSSKGCYEIRWRKNNIFELFSSKTEECRNLLKRLEIKILSDYIDFSSIEPEPLKPTKPTILLPLSLEIRYLSTLKDSGISIVKFNPSNLVQSPLKVNFKNFFTKEYWIRWYPNDIHIPSIVGRITTEEQTLWNESRAVFVSDEEMIESIKNYDNLGIGDEEKKKAIERIMEALTVIRAKQLAKNMILNPGEGIQKRGKWDFDIEEKFSDPLAILMEEGVKIRTLPEKIYLYTITNENIDLIQEVVVLTDEIDIKPIELNQSHWTTNFEEALRIGMGVKIQAEDAIQKIKNCDWLVALGVNTSSSAMSALKETLNKKSAMGELALVKQDTPTNNTQGQKSNYTKLENNLSDYFKKTFHSSPNETVPNDVFERLFQDISDVSLLGDIFDLQPETLGHIEGIKLHEQNEATAISALLLEACTLLFKNSWKSLDPGVSSTKIMKFFVDNVKARGNFPILRVNDNPYGILPVMKSEPIIPENYSDNYDRTYAGAKKFLFRLCNVFKWEYLRLLENKKVPKIDVDSNQNSLDLLLEILRTTSVSKKLEVRLYPEKDPDSKSDNKSIFNPACDPCAIPCALVKSTVIQEINDVYKNKDDFINKGGHLETVYLYILSKMNNPTDISDLYSTNEKMNPSVLERIIYYYLENYENDYEISFDFIKRAASYLVPLSPEKLEILLLEVMDLFSHRLDAWITGFAHSRLLESLNKENLKPTIGAYGWLYKPSFKDKSPISKAEYIQTPSLAQAAASALLRNASIIGLNPGDNNPFEINLSSEQVRKGLWYLEGLRQRHTPGELLGQKIERLIHDLSSNPESDINIEEIDIYILRRMFPLQLQTGSKVEDVNTFVETIINGQSFLDATEDTFRALLNIEYNKFGNKNALTNKIESKIAVYSSIQPIIEQIKDAASDIAIADVVYQYMMGNTTKTAAWFDFLEGEIIPPKPDFIRNYRTGDWHGTRSYLVIDTPKNENEIIYSDEIDEGVSEGEKRIELPRQISAPIVNHLCNQLLSDFEEESFKVKVFYTKTDFIELSFKPKENLNFGSIDLLSGGEEELELITRYYILQKWKDNLLTKDNEKFNNLGEYPTHLTPEELLYYSKLEFNINKVYIERAKLLLQILNRNKQKGAEISLQPNPSFQFLTVSSLSDLNLVRTLEICLERVGILLKQLSKLKNYVNTILEQEINIYSVLCKFHNLLSKLNILEPITLGNQARIKEIAIKIDNQKSENENFNIIFEKHFGEDQAISTLIEDLFAPSPSFEASYNSILGNISKTIIEFSIPIRIKFNEISRYGFKNILIPLPDDASTLDYYKKIMEDTSKFLERKISKIMTSLKNISEEVENWDPATSSNPLVNWLNEIKLNNDLETDLESQLDTFSEQGYISSILSVLQQFTDGSKLPILTPYILKTLESDCDDWEYNFTAFDPAVDLKNSDNTRSELEEYALVRRSIQDLLTILSGNNEFKLNALRFREPLENFNTDDETEEDTEESDSEIVDYFYISSIERNPASTNKIFSCLLIDQWNEFFPNMVETSGIAYKYNAPQSEAPNAILMAVPPQFNDMRKWFGEENLLAETVRSTLELMKIRMVGSEAVKESPYLGQFLPALLFNSSNIGKIKDTEESKWYHNALFPDFKLFLHDYHNNSSKYDYFPRKFLNEEEREIIEGPDERAERSENYSSEEEE
ncbi:MAG: hypothetical protein ACTSWD_15905 [Candidatus Heimdallarchaeota archaeon]